jgi:hypothetical protein
MQCRTNFSSFFEDRKILPQCRAMYADAEFWISFFTSLASGYDDSQRVGLLLFSKFFKILLKNFAPVCHGIRLYDIPGLSLHFPISESS